MMTDKEFALEMARRFRQKADDSKAEGYEPDDEIELELSVDQIERTVRILRSRLHKLDPIKRAVTESIIEKLEVSI